MSLSQWTALQLDLHRSSFGQGVNFQATFLDRKIQSSELKSRRRLSSWCWSETVSLASSFQEVLPSIEISNPDSLSTSPFRLCSMPIPQQVLMIINWICHDESFLKKAGESLGLLLAPFPQEFLWSLNPSIDHHLHLKISQQMQAFHIQLESTWTNRRMFEAASLSPCQHYCLLLCTSHSIDLQKFQEVPLECILSSMLLWEFWITHPHLLPLWENYALHLSGFRFQICLQHLA